jgi:hypothetical protein
VKRSIVRALGLLDLLIAFGALILAVVAAYPPTDSRVALFAALAVVTAGASGMAIFALDRQAEKLRKAAQKQRNVIRLMERQHDGLLAHIHEVGRDTRPLGDEAR